MNKTHIVPIDPKGKYVLIFKQALTQAQVQQAAQMLANWLASNAPFLILDNDTRLERIDQIMKEETVA